MLNECRDNQSIKPFDSGTALNKNVELNSVEYRSNAIFSILQFHVSSVLRPQSSVENHKINWRLCLYKFIEITGLIWVRTCLLGLLISYGNSVTSAM